MEIMIIIITIIVIKVIKEEIHNIDEQDSENDKIRKSGSKSSIVGKGTIL